MLSNRATNLLFLLTGLATAVGVARAQEPGGQNALQPPRDGRQSTVSVSPSAKAVVYVYREHAVAGAAVRYPVFLNGDLLADLRNGQFAQGEVSAGTGQVSTFCPHIGKLKLPEVVTAGTNCDGIDWTHVISAPRVDMAACQSDLLAAGAVLKAIGQELAPTPFLPPLPPPPPPVRGSGAPFLHSRALEAWQLGSLLGAGVIAEIFEGAKIKRYFKAHPEVVGQLRLCGRFASDPDECAYVLSRALLLSAGDGGLNKMPPINAEAGKTYYVRISVKLRGACPALKHSYECPDKACPGLALVDDATGAKEVGRLQIAGNQ